MGGGRGSHRMYDGEDENAGDDVEEGNEQEVDKLVEEFRQRLESCFKNQTNPPKRKMKPNISVDWITQLRQRLKSGSTQENSSNERYEKSPVKQATPTNAVNNAQQ